MRITRLVEKIYVHTPITKTERSFWGKTSEVVDWDATLNYIQEHYCSQGQEVRAEYSNPSYVYIVEVVDTFSWRRPSNDSGV